MLFAHLTAQGILNNQLTDTGRAYHRLISGQDR